MLAVLQDIRDELQEIKLALAPLRHLNCDNFLHIPHTLNSIRRNTAAKRRKKKNLRASASSAPLR